jgi:hypothetical protein
MNIETPIGPIPLGFVIFWLVVAAVFFLLLRKFWPLISNTVKIVDTVLALPAFMEESKACSKKAEDLLEAHGEAIAEIRHEVKPNGGSSLADAVNRSAEAQVVIRREVGQVKRQNIVLKRTAATTLELAEATALKLNEHISTVATNRTTDGLTN